MALRRAPSEASGSTAGVSGFRQFSPPWLLPKHTRTRAPSLHRNYPASPVLRPSPTPALGRHPFGGVEAANPTKGGSPSITRTTFPTCRAHYPGGSAQVLVDFFPVRTAFPQSPRGRHPQLHFRGLLRLHSRYGLSGCSPAQWLTLSRGFDPASYPAKPLVSYHAYRQLHAWVPPPLVIRAVEAHGNMQASA